MKALFVGDVCIKREIENDNFLSDDVINLIKDCDIRAFNMEGPIDGAGNCPIVKKGPSISQNKEVVKVMSENGFNYASLANNHIMDMGIEGLSSTITALETNNVRFSGASVYNDGFHNPCTIRTDEFNLALISVAENGFGCSGETCEQRAGGYAWMLDSMLFRTISEAKKDNDAVIMICHAGAEEFELPLPELRTLYKRMIDEGADAVVAHHPHVCQGVELYKGCPIIYSLGNFAFDGLDNSGVAYQPKGMMAILDIKKGGIIKCETIPTIYEKGRIILGDIDQHSKWLREQEEILLDQEKYSKRIDCFCERAFDEVYSNYYDISRGLHLYRFRSKLSTYVKFLIGKRVIDDVMLYHNIEIETHRWVVSRAIRNKYGI